ncbi:MAG: hypothetical protein P8Y70_05070 [Candidatus Lokiarchaeota archaeon]
MVFSSKYKFIDEKTKYKGSSGKKWKFDAIVQNETQEKFGIFIRDWKREISITQLRQLHKACMDVPEIIGGIMVCNIVTDFSRDYSDQFNIQLLSRGHLISKARQQRFQF